MVGLAAALVVLGAVLAALLVERADEGQVETASAGGSGSPSGDQPTTSTAGEGTAAEDGDAGDAGEATTTTVPFDGWVDPRSSGRPWGDAVEGLLTFRGNPTRTYYGEGPVPRDPVVAWRFPESGGLCAQSSVGGESQTWCGTGWTGQPAMFERDGRTWVAFGAYDRNVHFLDAATGERIIDDFPTGDIIKGTV